MVNDQIDHSDIVDIAKKMNTLIGLTESPPDNRFIDQFLGRSSHLPSSDAKIFFMAVWVVLFSYLRGRGLKFHHSSNTSMKFMVLTVKAIQDVVVEAKKRPFMYPKLSGIVRREEAVFEMHEMMSVMSMLMDQD